MSTSKNHPEDEVHGAEPKENHGPAEPHGTHFYTSWFTSFLSLLPQPLSRGGRSPEVIVVQATCPPDCRNIGGGDGHLYAVEGEVQDHLPRQNASHVINPTSDLPLSTSSPSAAAEPPQRSCLEKNKGVVMDVPRDPDFSFYCPGESSRFSSPISETGKYSLSSSFTSHGTGMIDTSIRADSFPRYPETELSSSFSSTTTTTSSTPIVSPVTATSPIFCPKNTSPKFAIATPRTESQTQDESLQAAPPRPVPPRPLQVNVFRQQELSKHVVAITVAFSPGVMILHHISPKTMTWGMSVLVVLLLAVGVAMLWNSNVVQDEFPVYAHRIQMLGFALSLAAFWGLISCFLWPSYAVIVPISCWAISAGILGIKAFRFEPPVSDLEHGN